FPSNLTRTHPMFVVHSYPLAVVLCVITMLCWGSWANTRKLARKNWRFELFYWDYALGVLLLTLALGITLGSSGTEGRSFAADLAQASAAGVGSALLGGGIFDLANSLLAAASEVAGMAGAFPVGIGLALIIGVIVNYLATRLGNGPLLAIGVLLVTLAIVLDATAYRRLPGAAAGLSTKGLVLSVACGVFMGMFYRFVAAAMYGDPLHPDPGKMGPYAAVFVFAVGVFLSNFVWNTLAMKKPFVGTPVSFASYFQGDFRTHLTGILGGCIWGIGMPLNLDWIDGVRINTSAVERRAATLLARRTVKKDWQVAWLLRAITCMDLTTLAGDDSDERVRRLCAKAMQPVSESVKALLGIDELPVQVAAVCVYHLFVETARRALRGTPIRVAAVSAGFPAGLNALTERLAAIRHSVEAGADEIDVLFTPAHVFAGERQRLIAEVAAFKEACGKAHCKVILGSGDLATLRNVARASLVAMMAGADFIKTSTGKEAVNATLPVGLVMARAIREYCERTGMAVGFKPAGGFRSARQSLDWLALMKEELGRAGPGRGWSG